MMTELEPWLASLGITGDPRRLVMTFGLLFARVAPVISLVPFLGGRAVPTRIKTGLALVIALILVPALTPSGMRTLPDAPAFVALLVKEAAIGLLLGVVAQFPFYALQMAGTIIDTQRGLNQISYLAPQMAGHTSAFGSLVFQSALTLFLIFGGHLRFLRHLAETFATLPIWSFPAVTGGLAAVAEELIRLTAHGLLIALQLAAPAVIAVFLVDVAFACLGKAAPRWQISGESQTAKSLTGLGLLLLSIAFLTGEVERELVELLKGVARLTARLA